MPPNKKARTSEIERIYAHEDITIEYGGDSDIKKIKIGSRKDGYVRVMVYDHSGLLIQGRLTSRQATKTGVALNCISGNSEVTKV